MAIGVVSALKGVAQWALKNPVIIEGAMGMVGKLGAKKDGLSTEDKLVVLETKVEQLGSATLELEQKIDNEINGLKQEIFTMKKIITAMGIAIGVLVVACIVSFFI